MPSSSTGPQPRQERPFGSPSMTRAPTTIPTAGGGLPFGPHSSKFFLNLFCLQCQNADSLVFFSITGRPLPSPPPAIMALRRHASAPANQPAPAPANPLQNSGVQPSTFFNKPIPPKPVLPIGGLKTFAAFTPARRGLQSPRRF
jgi:hypothetical protein